MPARKLNGRFLTEVFNLKGDPITENLSSVGRGETSMQTNQAAEQAAISAAERWLALVDAANYAESWNQASSLLKSGVQTSVLFKRGVREQQWRSSTAAVQTQLGKVEARSLRSKRYAEQLPGEPDGEYVVIEYDASFGSKKNAVEKVIVKKDQDGEWRVSGYKVILGHI